MHDKEKKRQAGAELRVWEWRERMIEKDDETATRLHLSSPSFSWSQCWWWWWWNNGDDGDDDIFDDGDNGQGWHDSGHQAALRGCQSDWSDGGEGGNSRVSTENVQRVSTENVQRVSTENVQTRWWRIARWRVWTWRMCKRGGGEEIALRLWRRWQLWLPSFPI